MATVGKTMQLKLAFKYWQYANDIFILWGV